MIGLRWIDEALAPRARPPLLTWAEVAANCADEAWWEDVKWTRPVDPDFMRDMAREITGR